MLGELMGPPTLITLPHAKGMKLKLEESEMMLLKRRVRRRTKEVFTCLKARTLSDSDSDSKPTVGGECSQ